MTGTTRPEQCRPAASVVEQVHGLGVTLICWAYFTLGFVCCFSFAYGGAYLLRPWRHSLFQRLTCRFYRIFFFLIRLLVPRCNWQIDPQVAGIRSSVIVCNHLSYLDPLLLLSLYPRHKTIVKTRFFSLPIFGWVLRHSGYLPADATGRNAGLLLDQMTGMKEFLDQGGNLFIFPQGTRSRDGSVGRLNLSALKIARMHNAPVQVLHLAGTETLYAPGRFLFTPGRCQGIRLHAVDRIDPVSVQNLPLDALEQRIRASFCRQDQQCLHGPPPGSGPGQDSMPAKWAQPAMNRGDAPASPRENPA